MSDMNRKNFFDRIRPMFYMSRMSTGQVRMVEAVLDGLGSRGIPLAQAAYILATAFHEADQFKTTTEYASGRAYEGRRDLGNTVKGDGVRFKGRGLVQITGRRNYTDWAKRLGVDIVAKPELAAELQYAVPILIEGMRLGTFTGKKLSNYIHGQKRDFVNARRIVNGTDKAKMIAEYALRFHQALLLSGYDGKPHAVVIPPDVPDKQPENSFVKMLLALVELIKSLFKGLRK